MNAERFEISQNDARHAHVPDPDAGRRRVLRALGLSSVGVLAALGALTLPEGETEARQHRQRARRERRAQGARGEKRKKGGKGGGVGPTGPTGPAGPGGAASVFLGADSPFTLGTSGIGFTLSASCPNASDFAIGASLTFSNNQCWISGSRQADTRRWEITLTCPPGGSPSPGSLAAVCVRGS